MIDLSSNTMHQRPRRTLAKIVVQYGDELIDDPRRTEALLNDLCGKHNREIFVLIQAQRRRVPAELRAAPAWMPTSTTVNRLTRQLEGQLALTPEAAAWAVESWAVALGLIEETKHSTWYKLLPTGILRSNRQPTADKAGKGGDHSNGKRNANGKHNDPQTRKAGRKKPTGQNATNVVQSAQEDGAKKTGSTSLAGSVKGQASLRPVGNRLSQFSVHLRRQTPSVLLWTTVLLISSALVWAMLDGAALSDSIAPSENAPPTPIAALMNDGELPAPTPSALAPGHGVLTQLYAPPQLAHVTASNGLNRREEPSLDATSLGLLPGGQSVTVIGFNADGRWAQLDEPLAGWVSTDYLAFNTSIGRQVRITLRSGRIQPQLDTITLHAEPSASSPSLNQIQGGETVTIIAATLDEQWYQIGTPVAGWLMTAAIELDPVGSEPQGVQAVGQISVAE